MPHGICRIGIRLWVGKFRFANNGGDIYRPLKEVCLTAFAESEFVYGLANSDLPIMAKSFERKVCLTAFAESEFGNP